MSGPEQLLAELRDIHLPLPVAPTSGDWSPVAVGVLMIVALFGVLSFVYWRRHRHLRAGLNALQKLAQRHARTGDAIELAQGLAQLLRRQAAHCFPADPVASLIDDEWLGFLDVHGGGGQFRHGPGALLARLPYQAAAGHNVDAPALLALAERWLRANPG